MTKWGFSEDKVGLLRQEYRDGDTRMSPETRKLIEEETKVRGRMGCWVKERCR